MKKYLLVFFIIFFLASCFGGKVDKKEEVNTGNSSTGVVEENKISYNGIEIDNSPEKINAFRNEISLDDIDLIGTSNNDGKNDLLKIGIAFKENLSKIEHYKVTDRIDGGINFEDYMKETEKLPEELKRNFILKLSISDNKTGKVIDKGTVYMNGIKFGDFKEGKFEKEFIWPKGIEKFNFLIRTDNYSDYFFSRNSINSEGKLIYADIKLNKFTLLKEVDLKGNKELKGDKFSVSIDNCSLVDSSGKCFTGKVKARISHFTGTEVNNNSQELGLNMKAIDKNGKITFLRSGGMAFTDFVNNEGEILKVGNGKKLKIVYKVTDKEISLMKNRLYGNTEDGYWMFDKNKNLWIEKEAEVIVDEKNKTWTVITSDIY